MDSQNKVAPLFYLSDLRIWASHSDCQNKFDKVVSDLGIDDNTNFSSIYSKLIELLNETLIFLSNSIKQSIIKV